MGWIETRVIALSRDKNTCQKCGATESLEVHHIIPRVKNGSDDMDNLVTLCYDCHKRFHKEFGRPMINRSKEIEANPHRHNLPKTPLRAIAKLTKGGMVSIPIEIRDILGLRGGDYVLVDVIQRQDATEKQIGEQGNDNAPCAA